MQNIVYLGLGTNLDDRASNLKPALERLAPQVLPLAESPVYQTPPWGHANQPDFLNQVIRASTSLSPHTLLAHVKAIENEMGREKTFRNGPRLIDLDILLYNTQIIQTTALTIPHPRLHERAFVLVPLADLAPGLQHPVLEETISALLAKIDARAIHPFATKS